jgi:hypothetical protein
MNIEFPCESFRLRICGMEEEQRCYKLAENTSSAGRYGLSLSKRTDDVAVLSNVHFCTNWVRFRDEQRCVKQRLRVRSGASESVKVLMIQSLHVTWAMAENFPIPCVLHGN